MKVNFHVIYRYLSCLTEGYAASDPADREDWKTYRSDIEQMMQVAQASDDEDLLWLAIDSLVSDPACRIDDFRGQVYGYSNEDLVSLFSYAFEQLWPDRLMSRRGEGPAMSFVPMSDREWAARRGRPWPPESQGA